MHNPVNTYVILIRGINVGGKNKITMTALKTCLNELGFCNILTYIASGNVFVQSNKSTEIIKKQIETELPRRFKLDSKLIKVLVLSADQFQAIITNKPTHFGEQPDTYHSDVIFLIDIDTNQAMAAFSPREGVDMIWQGDGVVYSQRLSAQRTKSRLGKIVGSSAYKSMTIRSWNTVLAASQLLRQLNSEADAR